MSSKDITRWPLELKFLSPAHAESEARSMRRQSHPQSGATDASGKEVFNDEKVVLVMVGLPARYIQYFAQSPPCTHTHTLAILFRSLC